MKILILDPIYSEAIEKIKKRTTVTEGYDWGRKK